MPNLNKILKKARELSWQKHGHRITFYLPGMIRYDTHTGKYPAVSITGDTCGLNCEHCRAKLLASMVSADTPARLKETCRKLAKKGNLGVLISGGCDANGQLPWKRFCGAIAEIKAETGLYISVHSGLIDEATAMALKQAGADQALIDVIGDDKTFKEIYHVDSGLKRLQTALKALQKAGLQVVPHIVCGLYYGRLRGEKKAVRILAGFDIRQVVIVSLMKISGTPLAHIRPLEAEAVAEIIAETRFQLPQADISLGCARERGNTALELLAIDAGVNRLALPSETAVTHARAHGLEINYQRTCCSVMDTHFDKDDSTFF